MFISQFNDLSLKNKIQDGYSHNLSVSHNGLKSNDDIFISKFNNKVYFKAGWTPKVAEQIKTCNVDEIVKQLAKLGLETDFKDAKTIACCCSKVVKIFGELNHTYSLGLVFPKAIYVEDFSKLKVDDPEIYSFCNWFPSKALKDSNKVFPERTLFFNLQNPWNNIDPITEDRYKDKYWSNNHFLALFIHEFGHAAHQGNLRKRFNYFQMENMLKKLTAEEFIFEYQRKFNKILSKLSEKATHAPLETIAEDMSRKISESLNEQLNPIYNPFKSSPYPNKGLISSAIDSLKPMPEDKKILRRILKRAWNGEDLL